MDMEMYDFTIALIREAGHLLEKEKKENFSVAIKNDNPKNIVTSLDIKIGEFISNRIHETYPEHGIHNEEAKDTTGNEYLWTIDPIDGTSSFARGIPQYSIAIGLLRNNVPVLGAVLDPVADELFSFRKGEGVWLNGEIIAPSRETELEKSFILLASGRKGDQFEWAGESLKKLLANVNKVKNFGSSALWLCYIASGRIEGVVAGTASTMDIASAVGILNEAGGVMADKEGNSAPLSTTGTRLYASNNQEISSKLRKLLEH